MWSGTTPQHTMLWLWCRYYHMCSVSSALSTMKEFEDMQITFSP